MRLYNKFIGLKFRGVRSNEIYTISNISIYIHPIKSSFIRLNLIKPKSRVSFIVREITLVPRYKSIGIQLKDVENLDAPLKNSWIIRQSENLVDAKGRLKISWNEKLILIDNEKD